MVIKKEKDTTTTSFEAAQTVRVKKKDLSKLLTCSICNNFFKDPVNITECLHIFCNGCISKKITEEDLNTCPVCDVYLGCMPLDKLRPDHNWRFIRTALAPSLGHEIIKDEPEFKHIKQLKGEFKEEADQSTPLRSRRKERSLASLGNEVKLSEPTSMGRREKGNDGKVLASQGSAMSTPNLRKSVEECSEGSNHSDQSKGQSFKQQIPLKGRERTKKIDKRIELVNNLLNDMAESEIIRNNKTSASDANLSNKATAISKCEAKSSEKNLKSPDAAVAARSTPSAVPVLQPIRKSRGRPRKSDAPEGPSICPQSVSDNASKQHPQRVVPVWLSLVPAVNQEGVETLPQIPRSYLMIKDVTLPVLFIKKYLVQKLQLNSEDEVEIMLWDMQLPPDLEIHHLVQMWSLTTSEKMPAVVGDSAQDFVMVLSYARK